MAHTNYTQLGYSRAGNQHNIMAFIGNGFDLQILKGYGLPYDTRYTSFYHFLKLRSFNPVNPILVEMEALLDTGKENWSDVEFVVSELLDRNDGRPQDLASALAEIQQEFAEFLEIASPSAVLSRVGSDSRSESLAIRSLKSFLGDLDAESYKQLRFPANVQHFDVFNFHCINFNYTSLFDCYIYLDQVQYDPFPYKTVDRNFRFEVNPSSIAGARQREKDTYECYLMTTVDHPHGRQSIPHSLLFGIDTPPNPSGNHDPRLRLAKPFWAQNERRYAHLIADTELFIVFGCSLGPSDRWWWKAIADSLKNYLATEMTSPSRACELIIYWYNDKPGAARTQEEIARSFFESAGYSQCDDLLKLVQVVTYDVHTKRHWLPNIK